MKNVGIVRVVEDKSHTFIVKLDSGCVPQGDDRKVFAVVDPQFATIGTCRILEQKAGLLIFEVMIPNRKTALAIHGMASSKSTTGKLWGRSKHIVENQFTLQIDVLHQSENPLLDTLCEYHPKHKGKKANQHHHQYQQHPFGRW